jgi:hypothetical protein
MGSFASLGLRTAHFRSSPAGSCLTDILSICRHVSKVPSPEVASCLLRFIRHVAELLQHSRIVEVASGGIPSRFPTVGSSSP